MGNDIKVCSTDNTQCVIIKLLEIAKENYPSLKISVEIKLTEFSGSSTAWISQDVLKSFANSLDELSRKRTGQVYLESMSPKHLQLAISPLDSVGHFLLEITVSKHVPIDRKMVDHQVSGGFELDPGNLPELVREFKNLVSKC